MTVNLLAELETSIPDDAEAETPAEDEEAPVEEETSEEAPDEETPEEGDSEESEEEEAEETPEAKLKAKVAELDEKAKFKIGDEEVTGEELKKGYLRQADYTKKTQALAEKERARTQELGEVKETAEEYEEWIGSLQDAKKMHFEIQRHFPEQYEELRDMIIEEALAEQDMTPRELDLYRRNKRAEIREQARKLEEEVAEKRAKKSEQTQKTEKLVVLYDTWFKDTLAESGLDPADADHKELVRARLISKHREERWTKETFLTAAKFISKTLGKTPEQKKEQEKKAETAKLPPVRGVGAKAPSAKKEEKKRAAKAQNSSDFFAELRRKNGIV